ncbi:hypothetical protein IPL68_07705 [Candidatus Saccharibacteria bacterium]|nr:MAG: hypothetical protein IPL68_07705 [Candidatus Saccharibacteria bacterium]
MTDGVIRELHENQQNLRGITTGATYDPRERHIAVYAGNIAALGLPDSTMGIQEAVRIVDRTIRLALGRFVHTALGDKNEHTIQEVMISRRQPGVPKYQLNPDEKMIRSALHQDMWPAFLDNPLSYALVFMMSNVALWKRYIRDVNRETPAHEVSAAEFENQTRFLPVLTYKPTGGISFLI